MNPLSSKEWTVHGNHDAYKVRVCAPLAETCAGNSGVGICQITPSQQSFGLSNSTVFANLDEVTIQYSGGSVCSFDPTLTLSAIISFVCSPCLGAEVIGPTLLTEAGTDGCTTTFYWLTPSVCSPDQLAACSTTSTPRLLTTTTPEVYTGTTGTTGTVSTGKPTTAPSKGSNSAAVAGAVVGVIVGVILLGVAGYYIWRRLKQGRSANFSIKASELIMNDNDEDLLFGDDAHAGPGEEEQNLTL